MSRDEQPTVSRGGMSTAEVAKKIQFLITTHRVTFPDLAAALNVRRDVLQDIVDGNSAAAPALLKALAGHFGVSADFFEKAERSRSVADVPDFGTSSRPVRSTGSSVSAKPASSVEALAVRHQALLEALVEKGILSAAEYHESILKVEQRRGPK